MTRCDGDGRAAAVEARDRLGEERYAQAYARGGALSKDDLISLAGRMVQSAG
ncbi:hypothetical protein ACFLIM_10595 [Nonomuraea sp. M3C6]|uniref:Uncharacterized protein n=1 Tax=Nonomuraea marmarensis TaxID=3351344 RepID=A0ABW7AAY0_9ACTN